MFISFSGEEGLSFDIERGRPEDDESVCWAEKSCRMLSKRSFFPSAFGRPLSSADTRPGARTGIQAGANIDWAAGSSCVAEFVTSSSCSFFT